MQTISLQSEELRSTNVGVHRANGIIHHSSLFRKIQKRLVRVLISHVGKVKYEKASPFSPHKPFSVEDHVGNTRHNLVTEGNLMKCFDCRGGSSCRPSSNACNSLKLLAILFRTMTLRRGFLCLRGKYRAHDEL